MHIALISDIHANLHALKAVLNDIASKGVDQIIFLGDAATIGPYPRETLETLQALNCVCIMGNHDATLLEPARAAEFQIADSLLPTLDRTLGSLSESHFDFLRSFLPTYEMELQGGLTLLCFHASPRSNIEMVLSTTPKKTLTEIFSGQSAEIMAGGHTHIQMYRQYGEQVIINPGSVGSAFVEAYIPGGANPRLLPWAEYGIIRADKSDWSVDLRRVRYEAPWEG